MKLKSFIYTALCATMFMATGCTESEPEYTPAPASPTPEIYFSAANATSIRALDGDTKFTVNVYRKDDADAKSYPLLCNDQTDASLFEIPAQVSFAAGESVTSFQVDYVAETLEGVKPYNMTFVVGEGENTPYALQTVTYTVTYYPWEDVVGPNGEEFGVWRDDIFTSLYNWPEQILTWDVKIQSSPAIKGLYRVVNPYGPTAFPGLGGWSTVIDNETHYFYLNCADPAHIFICDENGDAVSGGSRFNFVTGVDLNYGMTYISGMYNNIMASASPNIDDAMAMAGTLTNGVIKFPERSLLIIDGDGAYYANVNGKFRILFPGAEEEKDPNDVWETLGTAAFTDPWITPLWGDSETWNVEVEQWKKDPNMYRLVNPYKDGVMPEGWNYEGDKYFVFDATNPNVVLVEDQEIYYDEGDPINGSVLGTNFAYAIMNMVAEPWTEEQIISQGRNDTFANQVFTFGLRDAMVMFPNTQNEEYVNQIISTNLETEGKVILNSEAAEAAAYNRRAAVARKALLGLDKNMPSFRYETGIKNFCGPKREINL